MEVAGLASKLIQKFVLKCDELTKKKELKGRIGMVAPAGRITRTNWPDVAHGP